MKRLCLAVIVSIMAIFGFTVVSWAGEASVFDSVENIVIRAFTSDKVCSNDATRNCSADADCGGTNTCDPVSPGPHGAYLEVWDSTGTLMPVNTFTVGHFSGLNWVSVPVTSNPFQVHNDISSADLSLSLDSGSGAAYLFCTNTGLHIMKYTITNLANGHCGSADGKTLATQPPSKVCSNDSSKSCSADADCGTGNTCISNLCGATDTASSVTTTSTGWEWTCTGGQSTDTNPPKTVDCSATASSINGQCVTYSQTQGLTSAPESRCSKGTVDSFTSTADGWTWNCLGIGGGQPANNCSAKLLVNGTCVPYSQTVGLATQPQPSSLCNPGTSASFTTTDSGWTWNCLGAYGGTSANGCSAKLMVDGACGTTVNTCTKGNPSDIPDSTTDYLWNCTGLYSGADKSCNLPKAKPDLIVISRTQPGAGSNGAPFPVTMTVKNVGAGAAGAFYCRVYIVTSSQNSYIGARVVDNATQRVAGLAPGNTVTCSFPNAVVSGMTVHGGFRLLFVADADKEVDETVENTICPTCYTPSTCADPANVYYHSNVMCGGFGIL